jgi:hypothetical protein
MRAIASPSAYLRGFFKGGDMGEWSEYFEDFPEEDPGNYDELGRFVPDRRLRSENARQRVAYQRLAAVPRTKSSGPSPVTSRGNQSCK